MFGNGTVWPDRYSRCGALWIHDGNPNNPHALLTSGNHSGCYFNSRLIDRSLLYQAACDLFELAVQKTDIHKIKGVVGPKNGATQLAKFMCARKIQLTGQPCFWASPEKVGDGDLRQMVFNKVERQLLSNNRPLVIICEDAITTAGSVKLTVDAVMKEGAEVVPLVAALMNWSGQQEADGREIISLVNRDMTVWKPNDCPLCKAGSQALRPKDNWEILTASQ
ncbi:MAG TPA: hypothetical protein VLK22_04075 [Candidatus Udaeobacter sp.]|nr:hypothetical protein [Candidatus Udaeobacter sp.]